MGTTTKAIAFAAGLLGLFWAIGARAQTTLTESFTNTTYDDGAAAWTAANAPGTTYVPTLTATAPGNGALSLTDANTWEATYIYSNQSFSAANASIYTTFQYSSYGGNGADGITFFLFDASQAGSFNPGAYGGGLGYAQRDAPATVGLSGGYLGIGLDTFGNYSNPNEGKVGGIGFAPNAIAVRGPAAGNYAYLAGTGTLAGGINTADATTFNTVTIAITPTNQLSVFLQYAGSSTSQLVLSVDLSAYTRPDQLMFGFTAGTGGSYDNHLIRDLTIATATASRWKGVNSSWDNTANWNPGFVPADSSDILFDNSTVNTAQTVDLAGALPRKVRSVQIDAPFTYTLNNGTLEFLTGSFTGASGIFLTSTNGAAASQTINSSLTLDNDIEIKNSTTSALSITGNVTTNGHNLTLDGNGTGTTTLSTGTISGGGSVTKNDSGTVLLSGTNSYSGGTTLNAGTLIFGNNSALGSNTVTINGGTLAASGTRTIVNDIALQGNAGLAVVGASTLTSQGTLTQTGGSYTLNLGGGVTQQGAVNLSDNNTGRTLTVQVDSGAANISGSIVNGGAGAGSLVKTGAGTLQLNTGESYSGGTTISNGTLQLGASDILLNTGAVSIGASGTLNLNTFSQKIGNLTALAGGATIDFGAQTGANTLVFGTYTAPASGVLVVNNFQQGTTTDTLATTVAGQNVSTIYLSGFGVATEAPSTSSTLYGSAYALTPVTQTGIYWKGTTDVNWTPGSGTNWVTSSGGSTTSAPPGNTQIAIFDSTGTGHQAVTLNANSTIAGLRFDTSAPIYTISGTNTLTLSGTVPYVQQKSAANQTLSFTTLAMGNNTVFDFTGAGNLTVSSVISGAYNLIKDGTGAGRLILSGNNTFTGGVFINNGILQMRNSAALGVNGTTTIANGAALEVGNGINANEPISVTGSGVGAAGAIHNVDGSNTLSGAVTLTGATTVATDTGTTLNLTGNVTGANYGLTLNGAGNLTIGAGATTGVIGLGTGSVTINSTGTTTFAGTAANTYAGTTTVNSGTLLLNKSAGITSINGNLIIGDGAGAAALVQVNTGKGAQINPNSTVTINSDGTLNLNGQSNTVAQLNATASTAQVTLGAGTITVGGDANLNSSYAGTITGTGGLTKAGSGALTLTNASSSYSGPTAINAGIVNVTTGGALGTSAVTVINGASLQVSGLASNLTNTVNLNGTGVGGAGALEATTGSNTLTGNTTLQSNARIQADTGSTLNLTTGTLALSTFTLDVDGGGSTTISRVISGTGGVTMDGTGTLALSGTNTYTGATAVNSGTLEIRNNSALGGTAGTTTVANGATLALNNATPIAEVTTTINGAGVGNNGALRNIAGNNTWSGTVALASSSSIGADTGTTLTVSGVVSGASSLTKVGAGTLVLNAVETYTGATNINAGTLQLGAANLIANTSAVTVASGATFALNNYSETVGSIAGAGAITLGSGNLGSGGDNTSTTFSGVVSGTGNIVKNGTGTLTMSGDDIRTGGTTTINAGILKLGVTNAIGPSSSLTLSGGTFATNGFSDIVNGLYLTANSTIDYSGLAGILTLSGTDNRTGGTLTINNWSGNTSGGGANQLLVSNATALNGTFLTNITFTGFSAGAQIINVGGIYEVVPVTGNSYTWNYNGSGNWTTPTTNWTPNGNPSGIGYNINFGTIIGANSTVTLNAARTAGYVNFSDNNNYTIAPDANNYRLTMDVGGGSAQINVTNTGSPTISTGLTLNDNLIINQDNAGGTLTLSAANAITSAANRNLTVNGAGNTTISGTITTGAGTLTKNDTGTLTLSAANTYTGATTINGGTLVATSLASGGTASSIGRSTNVAGNLVLNGGTLQYTGAAVSANRLFTLGTTAGSTIDASGSGALNLTNGGTIALSGTNTARTFTLTGSNAGANTLTAILGDNGTGATSLAKSGAGTWVLAGANTYTGDTLISQGTLRLGAGGGLSNFTDVNLTTNAAIFDVNGQTDTVGSIAGVGGSTIMLGAGSLTSGSVNNGSSTTFAGTITGTGSLTHAGAGTLTLSGANTYTGVTSVTGGVLAVTSLANGGANSNIGASSNAAANLVLNGGTLQYKGTGASTDRLFTLGTTAGSTIDSSGTGALNFANTGATVLSGANTARTLTLTGSNIGANTLAAVLGNNGTGATSLTKNGTGTWVLSGANTFAGATAINAGTLEIQSATALGNNTGATTVASGASLIVNNAGMTVAENLTLNGFGVGTNGALRNTTGTNIWSGTVALNSDSSIGVDAGATLTASGVVSGAAGNSLTKIGAGTLVLSNVGNTYAGLTNVSGGVLSIAAEHDLGNLPGAVTVNQLTLDGGTLRNTAGTSLSTNRGVTLGTSGGTFDTAAALTVNSIVAGVGTLTKTGASTLTLSGGVNTYSGDTNISGGTLQLGVANALPDGTDVTISNGGILALNNNSDTVGSIATGSGGGSITLGSGTLTAGGNNASTTFSGGISGTGGLTKAGSGTLTITGASTYTGATTIGGSGSLQLGSGGSAMTGGSAVSIASGATFDVENGQAGNTIGLLTANSGSTLKIGSGTLITNGGTISGALQGSGNLTIANAGTLTISSNASDLAFNSGSITVNAGASGSTTLALGSAASTSTIGTVTLNGGADAAHAAKLTLGTGTYNITSLVVTGYSIIDFGNGTAATLSAGTFNIPSGTLSISNWVNCVDYFYAQNWTGATLGTSGAGHAPDNEVSFAASTPSYPANSTAWMPYDGSDSDPTKRQITPAPEPSTYGAIFMGLSLVGLGLRRWRAHRK